MGCINSVPSKTENTFDDVVQYSSSTQGADQKVNVAMERKRDAARRGDVFGESLAVDAPFQKVVIPKSQESKKLIFDALKHNFIFSSVEEKDLEEMVDTMTLEDFKKREVIIKEGDNGDFFYVVDTGGFDIVVNGENVGVVGKGSSFGELALLYNCPRAATITANASSKVWKLDRGTFRRIVARNVSSQIQETKEFLRKVPLLESLTETQFEQLSSAVQVVNFRSNERIISKGEEGNVLYIVKSGTVVCTDTGDNKNLEDLKLSSGDYFGERALVTNEPRAANVTAETDVEALAIDRVEFDSIFGSLKELIDKNMGMRVLQSVPILRGLSTSEREKLFYAFDSITFKENDYIIKEGETGTSFYIVKSGQVNVTKSNPDGSVAHVAKLSSGEFFGEMALLKEEPRQANIIAQGEVKCFVLDKSKFVQLLGNLQDILDRQIVERKLKISRQTNMNFEDLIILRTIGTGTFGRVRLVQHVSTKFTYALKTMQKSQAVAYGQEENVINEKNILNECDHPFILQLYQTFKDANCLYLLLEFIQGGELFTYLHCSGRKEAFISEAEAKFFASNVILALEYMHDKNILYRDLKPENLLIDNDGYLKVVDFGFAKVVAKRTFTLCGTPEYLAPELVLGKGHGKGVDYWALGVLLYEMCVGSSPFAAANSNDQVTICRKIISAKPKFPSSMSKPCQDLISQLLTRDQSKRIGCTLGGVAHLKNHSFWNDIDWKRMAAKDVTPKYVPEIADSLDTSNFDLYEEDEDVIPYISDGSTWDADF